MATSPSPGAPAVLPGVQSTKGGNYRSGHRRAGRIQGPATLNALVDPAQLRRHASQLDRHGPADRPLREQVHRQRRSHRGAGLRPRGYQRRPQRFRLRRHLGGTRASSRSPARARRSSQGTRRQPTSWTPGLADSLQLLRATSTPASNVGTNGLITLERRGRHLRQPGPLLLAAFSTIAPYWDDLETFNGVGAVYYQVQGRTDHRVERTSSISSPRGRSPSRRCSTRLTTRSSSTTATWPGECRR